MNGPFSRIIDAVSSIAQNLGITISKNTGNRLADTLEGIASDASTISHGASVPAAGTNDKDKYLHTNASTGALEWSEVAGGGTGGLFLVEASASEGEMHFNPSSPTKTSSEVKAAIERGQLPILKLNVNNGEYSVYFAFSDINPDGTVQFWNGSADKNYFYQLDGNVISPIS